MIVELTADVDEKFMSLQLEGMEDLDQGMTKFYLDQNIFDGNQESGLIEVLDWDMVKRITREEADVINPIVADAYEGFESDMDDFEDDPNFTSDHYEFAGLVGTDGPLSKFFLYYSCMGGNLRWFFQVHLSNGGIVCGGQGSDNELFVKGQQSYSPKGSMLFFLNGASHEEWLEWVRAAKKAA